MRKHIIWSFDKDFLQSSLNDSNSYVELFDRLKIGFSKSMIKMLQYRIKVDNLDKTKFSENVKKNSFGVEKQLSEILIENSSYVHSHNLKNKLVKKGLLNYECYICGLKEWNEKEIVLQLDHINGKSNDNRMENLRLLCPNCHSQTETYAGKKKKQEKQKKRLVNCQSCNVSVSNKIFCDECDKKIKIKRRKVERPTYDELKKLIESIGYSATGRIYGVSDNSIRKWKFQYEMSL